jgi:threonine-phosphate decarboxylase
MIYGHGDDIYNYPNIKVNYSSNVNPAGIQANLLDHLAEKLTGIKAYPQPMAENLSQAIGDINQISSDNVLVTNGAVEAFYLVASMMANSRSLIYTPSFAEYEDACKIYHHQLEFRSNRKLTFGESVNSFDAVWICNPNNPDGKLLEASFILKLIEENQNTLFVLDEAYIEFVANPQSLLKEACLLKNLIVIRSLTKKFAIPGLRLGYLVANIECINTLKQGLMPWRINSLAIEAGLFCLSEKNTCNFSLTEWLQESKRFQKEIDALPTFSTVPSDTTFFLVKSRFKGSLVKQQLAKKFGLLVRDASNFRGLDEYHFRISVRSENENQLLINALKTWE